MRPFSTFPDRIVEVTGSGLLPTSIQPMPPGDIRLEERVRVIPPSPPWQPKDAIEMGELRRNRAAFPVDDRYWRFRERLGQHPTDTLFAWKNNPGPGLPVTGGGGGVDRIPEPAILEFKPRKRKRGLPDLWEGYGLFFMRSRLLDILLEYDPTAVARRRVVMRDPEGNVFDEDHHLVDVVRNIPAVDFANSVVDYHGGEMHQGERTPPRALTLISVRIREDLDPSIHIFRQINSWGTGYGVVVSDALKRRLEKVRPALRHIAFGPLYSGL
jgi:hypothetical protein